MYCLVIKINYGGYNVFKFNKKIKFAIAVVLASVALLAVNKLQQIKMNFSTQQLEINFDQSNVNNKPVEK